MKIAVFSDSHGCIAPMKDAIISYMPNLVVHLGDYTRDMFNIQKEFPDLQFRIVKGNCDLMSGEPESDIFIVENKKIFITHGHNFGVKGGLHLITQKGREVSADLVMFGHTHLAYYGTYEGMHMLNPGSVGSGSWAKVEVFSSSIICDMITKV